MYSLKSESLKILREINPKTSCVSFSGGKDSLVALALALQVGIKRAVFCNTTVNYDATVKYVKKFSDFYDIDLRILTPSKSFFELTNDLGFPSRRLRWCCEALKFAPLAKFVREEGIMYLITGIRHEESFKRKSYPTMDKNPYIPAIRVNPIINWTNKDIFGYINKFELYNNPLYDQGFDRVGCWTCPFHTKDDWKSIEQFSPDKIKFLKDKLRVTFSGQKGVGLDDVNDFIEDYAWTKHVFSPSAKIYGKIHSSEDKLILEIENKDPLDLTRIKNLIPIISSEYEIEENIWTLKTEVSQSTVGILIEKTLNCVGCGVCIVLCPRNALSLDENGFIKVDENRCNQCLACLKTNLLRGACLSRNYAPLRKHIEISEDSEESRSDDFEISELCSGVKLGFIRTRMNFDLLTNNANQLGSVDLLKKGLFRIESQDYVAFISKRRGFSEIKVKTHLQEIKPLLQNIRSKILEIREFEGVSEV